MILIKDTIMRQITPLITAACTALTAQAETFNIQQHLQTTGDAFTTIEAYAPEYHRFKFSGFIDKYPDYNFGEAYLHYGNFGPTLQGEFGDENTLLAGLHWRGAELLYRGDGLAQFTYVWYRDFGRFSASGYVDVWDGKLSSQPQFWYSLDNGFSVGTEIDVYHHGGTVVTPSAAIKFGF